MYPWQVNRYLTENVNMNHNEEVPDFLGGLGDMLPADVLKKVNELLERYPDKHWGDPPRPSLCREGEEYGKERGHHQE